MIERNSPRRPVRLFLDAGVIIQGCFAPWGAAKAILILITLRDYYTVVLAESIQSEVERAIARKTADLSLTQRVDVANGVAGWLQRVRLEHWANPSLEQIYQQLPTLLPALRHANDLPSVVTAMQARPDWVISSNEDHWNADVANHTRLRIATPVEFLRHLSTTALP
jgi:predicted nucleic acid-binding protein